MPETYYAEKLQNGLQIQLLEIHNVPLISQWTWFRVGSRYEYPGITGISHWVEHMQFKGTTKFPLGILDRMISKEGGIWNAMTYLDWTTYFEAMPANKIDIALDLEADRMINSTFSKKETEAERTVIISEREGNENEPLFLLNTAVQQAAFKEHPYGHEVIGELKDLKTITHAQLVNHYQTYYAPNNCVISLAGDFQSERMIEKLKTLYSKISPCEQIPEIKISKPAPLQEQQMEVKGPGDTHYLQIAYRAPSANDIDFYPLTIVDSLLSGPASLIMFGGGSISNRTSRLYKALVENGLAVSVSGGLQATIDPYLYSFLIIVHPDKKPDEVLEVFDQEIEKIHNEEVSQDEIERAIKQAKAMFLYGSENTTNQAFWLGYANMFANYEWYLNYVSNLERVAREDIQTIVQKYLQPKNRVVGIFKPSNRR